MSPYVVNKNVIMVLSLENLNKQDEKADPRENKPIRIDGGFQHISGPPA